MLYGITIKLTVQKLYATRLFKKDKMTKNRFKRKIKMLQNNCKNISNVPVKQKVTKLRPILKSRPLSCLIYTNTMMY